MTNLLKELEAVVALRDARIEAARLNDDVLWNDLLEKSESAMDSFICTHHAEIAEALRDARRLDFVERCVHALDWDGDGMKMVIVADDGSEHKADTYRQAIDAAIDAMHNSAREVGE
jgi:hypothetical protein